MATFSVVNGINEQAYGDLALGGRTVITGDANTFTYDGDLPNELVTVFGTGFTYSGSHAVTGTVTSLVGLNKITGAQTFTASTSFADVAVYNTKSEPDQIAYFLRNNNAISSNNGVATNDVIFGGDKNDRINSGYGSDVIDAGSGDDTFILNFSSGVARVSADNAGHVIIDGPRNSHYVVSNVEHYQFTDGLLNDLGSIKHINDVFRFFDTKTGDHFYTSSSYEKQQIQQNLPNFRYEGASWATPDKGVDTIDVFRFFDSKSGDHVFTTSILERDTILKSNLNYTYEGVAFQAYANADTAGPGSITLERFFNTKTGQHHFAADASEAYGINHGASGANWVDEGKGFTVHIPTGEMLL